MLFALTPVVLGPSCSLRVSKVKIQAIYMSSLVLDFTVLLACLCLTATATPANEILEDYFDEPEKYNNNFDPDRPTLQDLWRIMDKSAHKTESKRALSILTRWKSLGAGVGRRTNALTKSPRAPMSLMQGDFDPKEMPGRRVGAPLRWG